RVAWNSTNSRSRDPRPATQCFVKAHRPPHANVCPWRSPHLPGRTMKGRADSFAHAEADSFVARCVERSGVAGAKAAWVGDMPISSNEFGFGVALLFVLEARSLTAFSPKKRCPF